MANPFTNKCTEWACLQRHIYKTCSRILDRNGALPARVARNIIATCIQNYFHFGTPLIGITIQCISQTYQRFAQNILNRFWQKPFISFPAFKWNFPAFLWYWCRLLSYCMRLTACCMFIPLIAICGTMPGTLTNYARSLTFAFFHKSSETVHHVSNLRVKTSQCQTEHVIWRLHFKLLKLF